MVEMSTMTINSPEGEAILYEVADKQARNNLASKEPAGTAANKVAEHNTNTAAHNDIRLLIEGLTTRLNALANSDDTTLDQMAEVVAYIKSNRTLIESVTTDKVNVADIINNLTTNVANKPLSAAQGVALKKLIDTLQTAVDSINVPTKTSQLTDDVGFAKQSDLEKQAEDIASLTGYDLVITYQNKGNLERYNNNEFSITKGSVADVVSKIREGESVSVALYDSEAGYLYSPIHVNEYDYNSNGRLHVGFILLQSVLLNGYDMYSAQFVFDSDAAADGEKRLPYNSHFEGIYFAREINNNIIGPLKYKVENAEENAKEAVDKSTEINNIITPMVESCVIGGGDSLDITVELLATYPPVEIAYWVSDAIPNMSDFASGVILKVLSGGTEIPLEIPSEGIIEDSGMIVVVNPEDTEQILMWVISQTIVDMGLGFERAGIYVDGETLAPLLEQATVTLQIPNYSGFGSYGYRLKDYVQKDELGASIDTALTQAKESGEFKGETGDDGQSAYQHAQAGGYTGTEAEFNTKLAELMGYVYSEITGEVDDNNNIVITGELADGTYTLKYENEDGTTTEIGTFTVGELPPAFTNLFNPATATLNKRWSDSGGGFTSTANGYVATDYIPVKLSSNASSPTLLRFRGATFAGNAAITFFDSTKKTLQASDAASNGTGVKPATVTMSTDENGDSCINLGWKSGSFHSNFANAAYFRIGLQVNASSTAITTADIQNIIITLDEPITD